MSAMFVKVLDRHLARRQREERAPVEDPRRARRVHGRMIAIVIVVLAALMTRVFTGYDGIANFLSTVALAGIAVSAAAAPSLRMLAYRIGWLDGRTTMVDSMEEAMGRGTSAQEWAAAEAERQTAVLLGIEPLPARSATSGRGRA